MWISYLDAAILMLVRGVSRGTNGCAKYPPIWGIYLCFLFKYLVFFFIYLRGRGGGERKIETERTGNLPYFDSLPQNGQNQAKMKAGGSLVEGNQVIIYCLRGSGGRKLVQKQRCQDSNQHSNVVCKLST